MNIWETIKAFFWYSNGKDPTVIDHVQTSEGTGYHKKLNKKLAEAERRHGKLFHTHENKLRETPPSRDLLAIQEQQQKLAASLVKSEYATTVTKIKSAKYGKYK